MIFCFHLFQKEAAHACTPKRLNSPHLSCRRHAFNFSSRKARSTFDIQPVEASILLALYEVDTVTIASNFIYTPAGPYRAQWAVTHVTTRRIDIPLLRPDTAYRRANAAASSSHTPHFTRYASRPLEIHSKDETWLFILYSIVMRPRLTEEYNIICHLLLCTLWLIILKRCCSTSLLARHRHIFIWW